MDGSEGIRTQFIKTGRRLFSGHLVGGNFGNLSARQDEEGFFITHTGSFLMNLTISSMSLSLVKSHAVPLVNGGFTGQSIKKPGQMPLSMPIPRMRSPHPSP